jgi:hypothetical protein
MITLGMATIPERKYGLERVLDSLVGQVDQVFLSLNGFYLLDEPWYPLFLDKYTNVFFFNESNALADAQKFANVHNCEGYYITADDDLVVAPDHVSRLIRGIDKYDGVCSFHGRVYPRPFESFMDWSANYRCLGNVFANQMVDLVGTGCMGFHTSRLKVSLQDFKYPYMADCFISLLAHEQSVPMWVLAHNASHFVHIPYKDTIWRSQVKDTSKQTEIIKIALK